MLETLHSLISFAAVVATVWGLGRPLVRWQKAGNPWSLEGHVWSFALGLVIAGCLLTALGLFGLLNSQFLRILTIVGCGWALGQLLVDQRRRVASDVIDAGADDSLPRETVAPPTWWQGGLLIAGVVAMSGALLSALAPPTAGDALCYHLELPKQFLQAESICFVPWHDNATFPLLTEMWFAWGMALEGAVTAQLIHWGLGVLFAAATACLARGLVGREWAWTAGAIALLIPGVTNQMTAPLNDIALAAFTTLALVAWRNCLPASGNTEPACRRAWILRAGLMGGAILSIKYVGLIFNAALAFATFCIWVRNRFAIRQTIIASVGVLAIAMIICGTWYVRAAWHHGNPVYPFFGSLAGAADAPETLRESKLPLTWSASDVASAPWRITMDPEEFGGRGHQIGCLILALVPGLVLARRLRGLGYLLMFALGYFFIWYALRQNLRFLLPAIPPLVVGATWVIAELGRCQTSPKWIARAAVVAALGLMAIWPAYRARRQVAVALGVESREEYLHREEPTYLAARFADNALDGEAKILSQDYRLYYFTQSVTRENIYRRETGYDRDLAPVDVSAELRAAGYTHVLLAQSSGGEIHYNATLSRLVTAAERLAPETIAPIFEYDASGHSGERRSYRLIELR